LEFRRDLAVAELSGTIDDVEAGVRAACPRARFIFIEPDLARGETTR
jgi:hypothetical protein